MINEVKKIKEILELEGSVELASYKCHSRRTPHKMTQKVDLTMRLKDNRITLRGYTFIPGCGQLCFDIPKEILLKFIEVHLLLRPIPHSPHELTLHPLLKELAPVDTWTNPFTVEAALQARIDHLDDHIMNGTMNTEDAFAAQRQLTHLDQTHTTLKILRDVGFFRKSGRLSAGD